MTSPTPHIAEFLASIGLSHLHDVFSSEDIDMSTLPLLDKDDLKELGLTLGQRKKLDRNLPRDALSNRPKMLRSNCAASACCFVILSVPPN